MLTQRAEADSTFGPRDLTRLGIASALLVVVLTAIFALDLLPQRLVVKVGDVASTDIAAPRAQEYVSGVQTQQKQQEARAAVEPVYDYTTQ
jgi:membrane-associated HD superfamily phosphohydrolase